MLFSYHIGRVQPIDVDYDEEQNSEQCECIISYAQHDDGFTHSTYHIAYMYVLCTRINCNTPKINKKDNK